MPIYIYFDLKMSMKRLSLVNNLFNFVGTINHLLFALLFVFTSSRYPQLRAGFGHPYIPARTRPTFRVPVTALMHCIAVVMQLFVCLLFSRRARHQTAWKLHHRRKWRGGRRLALADVSSRYRRRSQLRCVVDRWTESRHRCSLRWRRTVSIYRGYISRCYECVCLCVCQASYWNTYAKDLFYTCVKLAIKIKLKTKNFRSNKSAYINWQILVLGVD